MPIAPERYPEHSAYDLLKAAARGHVAFDHRLLHRLLDNPAETLPDIIRFANEDHEKDRNDISVDLIRIFAAAPTPEAVPFLIGEFRRFPEEVPDEMSEALARIGAPALEPLHELFEDGIAMDEVGFHMVILGVKDPRIEAAILEIKATDEQEGRSLEEIYAEYAGAAPEPYDIWSQYVETDLPDIDLLPQVEQEQFLLSESAELRALGVTTFLNRELSRPQVDRLLSIAQSDPDVKVRGEAWETLREYANEERISEAMFARLDNPNTPALEKGSLCIGLAYLLEEPEIEAHVNAAYADPISRAKAIEAMARSFDKRFAPIITRHIEDPDKEVRSSAIWGVGYLRIHAQASKLEKLFAEPEWRAQALYCYALAAPAEDNRISLRQLEDRIERLADGFEEDERELVHSAFDLRFEMAGKKTVYSQAPAESTQAVSSKIGRNDPCPCGSGKKYKKCCGA